MKRLIGLLLLVTILTVSCGGDEPDDSTAGGGIAALDEKEDPSSTGRADDKGKKGAGKKSRGSASGTDEKKSQDSESKESEESTGTARGKGAKRSSGPAAATPIPAGRYEYATDGRTVVSGNASDLPDRTTLTAEAPKDGLQHQMRDLRDEDGNGTVTETHLLYRADGVYLTYVKVTSKFAGGLTDVREFKPSGAELIAPTGGAPGFKRSFSMQGSGTRADVVINALRNEKLKVRGSVTRTLVVATKITFSGSLEGEQRSTSWFDPKHVMMMKERVSTDVRNGPIRLQSDYEALLQ